MKPEGNDPEMAALADLGTRMKRGRFKDALPEEEQRTITLILTPTSVEVADDSGELGEESAEGEGLDEEML